MEMSRALAEPMPLANITGLPPVSRLLVEAGLLLARWDDRRRTRNALTRLDAHLLSDIGLTSVGRDMESARPFWRG
ncbi:MAG: DUF1127 domain-containing protein [Rhodobacteraceae bacterium]|nr:DUF1127 domain-containing protein [Paracoccaceae bacterium]